MTKLSPETIPILAKRHGARQAPGPVFIKIVLLLQDHPGLNIEAMVDWLGHDKATIGYTIRRLCKLPMGHPLRLRVADYTRDHIRGPHSAHYEINPTKRHMEKPRNKPVTQVCSDYRAKRKALISLRDNKERSKFAQGGVYGIWAGLAA